MRWPYAAIALAVAAGCARKAPSPATETTASAAPDPLASLRAFEDQRRQAAKFLEQPAQDHAFGADPYALTLLRDGRVAGILRGADALVILDADLREVARVKTPASPSAIAATSDGVIVASEVTPALARYRVHDATITRLADIPVDALGIRGLVADDDTIRIVEEHDDRLIELKSADGYKTPRVTKLPRGPIRIVQDHNSVFGLSLLDHTITALPNQAHVTIDGPYWGLATGSDIVIAGGVEDHPLDRTGGFFGYVDSFVYGYRYHEENFTPEFALNVSAHGLIVPKAISVYGEEALITSYGGDKALRIGIRKGEVREEFAFPPGSSAIVRRADGVFVAANPLLDAWVSKAPNEPAKIVHVATENDARTDRERLGEALFFTGLMAPNSSAEGPKSRFSCETCHFEGYVDGRTHHTGRGDVHAVTKPLVGLFNNRPHFSRALDPDLSAVAENEFRVAGAPSTTDPHFVLDSATVPWLGLAAPRTDANELRVSLMAFLMAFSHRSNPKTLAPRGFSAAEQHGAEVFRDRCERCHSARAAADVPDSHVAFADWENRIFHGDALVWGSDAYEKTGIEPYVHERGARVPSLRRLYKKRPYFTNGSAGDLRAVVELARFGQTDGSFSHSGGDGDRLSPSDADALLVFLDLL